MRPVTSNFLRAHYPQYTQNRRLKTKAAQVCGGKVEEVVLVLVLAKQEGIRRSFHSSTNDHLHLQLSALLHHLVGGLGLP